MHYQLIKPIANWIAVHFCLYAIYPNPNRPIHSVVRACLCHPLSWIICSHLANCVRVANNGFTFPRSRLGESANHTIYSDMVWELPPMTTQDMVKYLHSSWHRVALSTRDKVSLVWWCGHLIWSVWCLTNGVAWINITTKWAYVCWPVCMMHSIKEH